MIFRHHKEAPPPIPNSFLRPCIGSRMDFGNYRPKESEPVI